MAILCDVAVERQVQISGPDASKFVQMMSPRDLSSMKVGQCKYVILTNQKGGILNDPVLLKLDDDRYWFSLADSDVLFWAQGLVPRIRHHCPPEKTSIDRRLVSIKQDHLRFHPFDWSK